MDKCRSIIRNHHSHGQITKHGDTVKLSFWDNSFEPEELHHLILNYLRDRDYIIGTIGPSRGHTTRSENNENNDSSNGDSGRKSK